MNLRRLFRMMSRCLLVVALAGVWGCDDSGDPSGSANSGTDTASGADGTPGGINNPSGGDSAGDANNGGSDNDGATSAENGGDLAQTTGNDTQTNPNVDTETGETGEDAQTAVDTSEPDPTDVGAMADTGGATPDTGSPVEESPLVGWCKIDDEKFSFFVTSMAALWTLSGDDLGNLNGGFGGNFGGIAGADTICQTIGATVGHGDKTWRAFLSATDDGQGNPVHAIERIGAGPWYDANGRLVATGIAGLQKTRPDGDVLSTDDLPDECGIPISVIGDAHDMVTGSNAMGKLNSTNKDSTCNDWTSSSGTVGSTGGGKAGGTVMCGHSFPRETTGGGGPGGGTGGKNWVSDHPLRGCGKGANLLQNGPGTGTCIGCSGGYGGLYCFAL